MWNIVRNSSAPRNSFDIKSTTTHRKGWRTIRVFVSTMLSDSQHLEYKELEKLVLSGLRGWCESRMLRVVECDLKWGVPSDTVSEETVKTCLSELDRCFEENTVPFFLNISEKDADLYVESDTLNNVAVQYQHVYGLSHHDLDVVRRVLSPLKENSLFIRLGTPEEHEGGGNEIIVDELSGDNTLAKISAFFHRKIDELYPLDLTPLDVMEVQKQAHSNFLDSRSACVLGRDKLINQIENYVVNGSLNNAPLLIVGHAGAGKSALMAKCAYNATILAQQCKIKVAGGNDKNVKVFYHFVGATPRSTDLASFLQRLTKEMKSDMLETQTSLDSLIMLAFNLLESPTVEPVVIFVDAINQMDEDKHQYLKRWIPEKLSPSVRLIISTIESTVSHQTIRSFKSSPTEIICGPLDRDSREAIVTNILRIYNKKLDVEQMEALLNKMGSRNPLWLTLACEELRVHEVVESLTGKIESLPDDLICLEETVFERFEGETGGKLMKACVCLLEVSRHGLLETEILALLGNEEIITMPEYKGELELQYDNATQQEKSVEVDISIADTKENISKQVQETYLNGANAASNTEDSKKTNRCTPKNKEKRQQLPSKDWAGLYRKLKRLFRPCGDLGEGRLDFYHRSLSKAVRKRYFSGESGEKKHKYNFWHGVLADFFEGVDDMDRKAEELPYHLEKLLDNNRLITCLMDWEVFDRMYNEDFSIDLLHSWRMCGGYGIANAVYHEQLNNLQQSDMPLIEYVEIVEKVYGFLIQAGQYSDALELMEERLKNELEELGERPEKMANIYENMARCKSEVDKAEQFVDPSQLNDNQLIVEYGRKCLQYRKQFEHPKNEYRCAMVNILIAHHLSNVADLTRETQPREESFAAIEEAIKVFNKLGDVGHISECLMTKAIIDYSMPFPEREKLLLESLDLCLKGYGENHLLTTRIYLNTGIAYSMTRDWRTAFEFFLKLKKICLKIFGPSHPKTLRAINTLNEPRFQRMAAERERYVPDIA